MPSSIGAGPSAPVAELARPTAAYRRQAWAAVLALVAFLLAYLGLAGWFLYTAYKLTFGARTGASSGWGWLVAACAAFLAVFMLKALFFVKAGRLGRELELKRSEQPRLFEDLDRLADRAGAPRPHRVFVTARVNASVFYDLTVLNLLFPSRKNLEIGLGLVNALTLGELHAVLAHEFGHFAQRSMAVGRWAYVAQQIAGHLVARRDILDDFLSGLSRFDFRVAWVGWILSVIVWAIRSLVEQAFRGVELIERALSREMELQADLVAVSVTGSDALIHALHKLQAADDSWDRTLGFIGGEQGKQRGTRDAFAVQTRILQRMGQVLNDPTYHRTPTVPAEKPEAHRVFRAEWAQPPQMWLTHPMNHVREENAKQRYVAAAIDERSAWVLFDEAQALREQVTARLIDDEAVPRVPVEESLATVDEQFSRETLRGHYRGVYLGRSVARHADSHHELCDDAAGADPTELAALYPESLLAQMEQWRGLERELGQLKALQAGHLAAAGGSIRFRGQVLKPQELSRVIGEVGAECQAVEAQLQAQDLRCRSLHRALARQLGGGHEARLKGLLALVHYAEHGEANLRDLQAVLASTWFVESAGRRVGKEGVQRLVRTANNLQDAMDRLHRQAHEVQLGSALCRRLSVPGWPAMLGEFSLPMAHPDNLGEWLKVVDGWVGQFTAALSRVRSAALDELLATETAVARATAVSRSAAADESRPPEPAADMPDQQADLPPAAPFDFPVLRPGQERPRETRLGWWARFQSANGFWPAAARLGVAGGIVAGVLGFSGAVGEAEINVYNGLAVPVTVDIDGQRARVGAHGTARLARAADRHFQVETRTEDGRLVEAFDAEAAGSYGHYAYNVAQAAALVEWTAVYGGKHTPKDRPLGAQRWVETRADFVFAEPPRSVSSKGATTRLVLTALEAHPQRTLEAVENEQQRQRMIEAHVRWDSTQDRHAGWWWHAATKLPTFRGLLDARLAQAPSDVLLLRLQQDEAGGDREAVCQRHRGLSDAAPQDAGLRYAAARCLPTAAERDRAFIDGHRQWPQNAWFAYAAGHSLAVRGEHAEALEALAQARRRLPALADAAAVDEARLLRWLRPADARAVEALAAKSEPLRVMLALETGRATGGEVVPVAYAELARGRLEAARQAAGESGSADSMRWLLAASDRAPASWAQEALAGPPGSVAGSGPVSFAAAGLAIRHGRDPWAYLDFSDWPDRDETLALREFVELLRRRGDLAGAERLLQALPIVVRAQACSMGVVAWGTRAPASWRETASRMLFAPERPYLGG